MSVVQMLHDFESNGEVRWKAGGALEVHTRFWDDEAPWIAVEDWRAAEQWFLDALKRQLDAAGDFEGREEIVAQLEGARLSRASPIDDVRAAGLGGYLYWLFDSNFHAQLLNGGGNPIKNTTDTWQQMMIWLRARAEGKRPLGLRPHLRGPRDDPKPDDQS
jgi:hypothetical protein